jgi:hypothetical protein
MTRTRKLTRRALLVAGTVVAMAGPFAPGLGSSDAHTCAYLRVNTTSVGECHTKPWPSGHDCADFKEANGLFETRVCADLPVAAS